MTGKREDEKKTSENIWKIYLKVFTFASAFLKRKPTYIKEAIFEEIYINNTSSTRARLVSEKKETVLGKIKRTVITY